MSRSIDEAISEVEREAHVRMRCFDKWISEGKLSRVDAWDRLERLLSAVKHLRKLQDIHVAEAALVSATAPEASPSAEPVVADFTGIHTAIDSAVKFGA